MYRKYNFLLFVLIISSIAFSQTNSWYHYDWKNAETINEKVFADANEFYKNYYKDDIYVGDNNKTQAYYQAVSFYTDYKLGNIYPSFNGYESYIKEILSKVVKDTAMINKLKIYFYYDSEFSASMDALGNLRVYVGLFNYINTEAELAAVLAHEYAHFFNKDGIEKNNQEYFIFEIPFYEMELNYHGKKQEAAADFLAINYLKESPYTTKGMANTFKILKRFEIKAELVKGNNRVKYFTHPDPGDRLKQVKILAKDSINIGKKSFVVDSLKFFQLKKIASNEALSIMLERRQFTNLIELSFTRYLYEPDNLENLALLNESIRRYLVLSPNDKSKQFIIEKYKGRGSSKSENYKFVDSEETSILKYLNKGLLHLQSNDLNKLSAKNLLDTSGVKFTSYEQAQNYFLEIAKELNCKECLITTCFKSKNKFEFNDDAVRNNTVFDISGISANAKGKSEYANNIYVLRLPSNDHLKYFEVGSEEAYFNFLKDYVNSFKEEIGSNQVYLITDLPFKDQHRLNSMNALAESIVKDNLYRRTFYKYEDPYPYPFENALKESYQKTGTLPWESYSPELFDLFSNYGVKNIYLVDFESLKLIKSFKDNRIGYRFKKISLSSDAANVAYEHKIFYSKDDNKEIFKTAARNFKFFTSTYK